jgi:indolepyruvate ferredoxin oxidoreductase, alpha subunit
MKHDKQIMVNGNEAAAWAALLAGTDYFAHYPGSPVNLVEPYLKNLVKTYGADMKFNDSLNEHIAALSAAGASFTGARSMLVMKHVGMNIAADPFNYIGYTGVKGGMVIVVGTDPGANCSTGEEDVHWYIPQVNFPLLEPTSVKSIFEYVYSGFSLSEKYQLPVVVFVPTRLCYNYDTIEIPGELKPIKKDNQFYFEKNSGQYINVGQRTIKNHKILLNKIESIGEQENYSRQYFSKTAGLGIITRGITFCHTYESIKKMGLEQKVGLLRIDLVYPVPKEAVRQFAKNKNEIIFMEDQDGFLENQVKMNLFNELKCTVLGKEIFPKYGEIQAEQIMGYLSQKFDLGIELPEIDNKVEEVPERLGTFCEGCPHRAAFYAIYKSMEGIDGIIGGDIGCSSLPPFKADWLLCMNAGIGISQGMSHILKKQQVVSTGGEGSFFHAGFLSLQSAILNKIDLLHIVFDNGYVAMTGHQSSPTTSNSLNYRRLLKTIGVDKFYKVKAQKVHKIIRILKKEYGKKGVRVIWIKGECVQKPTDLRVLIRNTRTVKINNEKCGVCTECYSSFGCPAINSNGKNEFWVDETRCLRCGTCLNICKNGALKSTFNTSFKDVLKSAKNYLIKS